MLLRRGFYFYEYLDEWKKFNEISLAKRDHLCHSINRYEKASHKYMRGYDRNKESSHINYWDINHLYGSTMSQKLPGNSFEWVKIFLNLIKAL